MDALKSTREQLLACLANTSRHLDILSPALEPALFDHEQVVDAVTALARRGRQSRIRILIEGLEPSQFSGHRLIAVARRLTTAVTVKELAHHPEWNRETVVICDRSSGLLLVPEDKRLQLFSDRPDAQRWAETFDRLWLAANESLEMRQFR